MDFRPTVSACSPRYWVSIFSSVLVVAAAPMNFVLTIRDSKLQIYMYNFLYSRMTIQLSPLCYAGWDWLKLKKCIHR